MALIVCRERPLPPRLMERALRRAVEINPENDRVRRRVDAHAGGTDGRSPADRRRHGAQVAGRGRAAQRLVHGHLRSPSCGRASCCT